jgi:hypothetical protein
MHLMTDYVVGVFVCGALAIDCQPVNAAVIKIATLFFSLPISPS